MWISLPATVVEILAIHSAPCPPKGQDLCPDAVTQPWDTAGCSWCPLAFPHTCPAPLRSQNCWDLSFRCFVSSFTSWAKFLCLLVLLFSLSAQLLQILIWLPYLGFVLPDLNEATFTTQSSNWHCGIPCLLLLLPVVPGLHISFTPLQHLGFSSSQDSKALPPTKTLHLLGHRKLKTVSDIHTSLN